MTAFVGGVIGAAVQTFVEVSNGSFDNGFNGKAALRILTSAGAGALGGGLGFSTAGLGIVARSALNVGGSSAIGGTSAVVQQYINQGQVTKDEVARGAFIGLLTGGVATAAGEGFRAAGRAVASRDYNSLSTSQKLFAESFAKNNKQIGINYGDAPSPSYTAFGTAASSALSSAGSLYDLKGPDSTGTTSSCSAKRGCR
ncbi:hypothetical protein EOI86_18670 [Hwanghaeella grinnelliae]|uniref:Uncharacterized protein n=1 Tax=Hwanghaeella grinnelliae TaxID=2500179 RepID=A0A437QK26_9PROT|nr:hypothetical protein [Hwanghaeella grinnelliae]RVU34864.1 hypothetical protein EOI86_18670 [Hwanghaeella grinnelliae]